LIRLVETKRSPKLLKLVPKFAVAGFDARLYSGSVAFITPKKRG